ncbi:flavin-binding monooxygenase [Grosmannia clavigera kw1407]|uniref:Flavin-binding monooxygenase n=1 Tax=Grosmannia clavigera (strain kw1407 / UAMH 11150) TaxID=655863 RepID=F0XBI3_GROCL|nr:flavin-binding monooxygenase [Grosmannia clavigera kw1407]EFX05107.1 flavin-binding monooxygenase [Grosmannia clavigera kw1407]
MATKAEKSKYTPRGRPVDEGRPVRITIIGAGISGICLYIRLLQHVPAAKITIYEKNPSLGGTWYENRYPGVACDVPSHVYQYSFEPNKKWTKLFAPGSEILDYIKGVSSKYGVDQKVKYSTRVIGTRWDEDQGAWDIDIEQTDKEGHVSQDKRKAEIIISAVGILNNWKWPDIQGLNDFQGKLLHSADWDKSWDYTGKKVALIGSGSSAVQILPHLQEKCPQVSNFVRGGAWISRSFGSTFIEDILSLSDEPGNYTYTDEEVAKFEQDDKFYYALRREMESSINKDFPRLFPGSIEETEATERIKIIMRWKLFQKIGLYEKLEPSFVPGCRRLTPGPGYLEALVQDNVDVITAGIDHVTEEGVMAKDGKEYKVDAIICATGFDCSHIPRFSIQGRDGHLLGDRWRGRASAYMSHSVPGFPNFFVVGGPNSATGTGSLLLILESVIGYVVQAVSKISREHIKSMEVREDSLMSWEAILDKFFLNTVYVDKCQSWYKYGEKVVGLWPGSNVHAIQTLKSPRWEDYTYEPVEGTDKLDWLGNGWTTADLKRDGLGYYVDDTDVPPVPAEEVLKRQP